MSDILCKWINEEVVLSRRIEPDKFSAQFSNGYLFGELLHKFGMQNDFQYFTMSDTANAKLNNFTRMEPTLALLDIKFDSNMAKEIIGEKPGLATRVLYQLFIALGKKVKMNLTGVAMETMRPSGPKGLAYSLRKNETLQEAHEQIGLDVKGRSPKNGETSCGIFTCH